MEPDEVLQRTIDFVKSELVHAEGGHDWWHTYRVWTMAKTIAQHEQCNLFIVELGALLHDIGDPKFHNGDEEYGPRRVRAFLSSLNIDESTILHVENIVRHVSFKGPLHQQSFRSPELDVVQDADRLDALGALGIARAFNYGGYRNRPIYDPSIPPNPTLTNDEYRNANNPTLNHFYEKLLLLKDRMKTKTARQLAEHRHAFMEHFLEEFFLEWEGKR